jgi:hypothetical protein
LIYSRNLEEYKEYIKKVFKVLEEKDLQVKLDKYIF